MTDTTEEAVTKPKVTRSRRRLYQTPEEAAPPVAEEKPAKKAPAKRRRAKAKPVAEEAPVVAEVPATPEPAAPLTTASVEEAEQALQVETEAAPLEPYQQAQQVLDRYVWVARGIGLVPIPWMDFVGMLAVQTTMIMELGEIYGQRFSEQRAKILLTAVLSGAQQAWITGFVVGSLVKLVPGINLIGTVVTQPIVAGAMTYAVGKVFIKHFELGGTVLDLEPESTREYFRHQLAEGKLVEKEA